MPGLHQISFVEEVIADKISIAPNGVDWCAVMGQHLYIFKNDRQLQKFLLGPTYKSNVFFLEDEMVCCHLSTVDISAEKTNNYSPEEFCQTEPGKITPNHICTNVHWVDSKTALAGFSFFVPRNNEYDKENTANFLVSITPGGGDPGCRIVDEHPSVPYDCIAAATGLIATFTTILKVWGRETEVEHSLHFDEGLTMDSIFFTAGGSEMILIAPTGKLILVDTNSWSIISETFLGGYQTKTFASVSPQGLYLAYGNNEGQCNIYKKEGNGYKHFFTQQFEGIVTSVCINEKKIVVGLNGNSKRGTGVYEIVA